jgi:transposase
MAKVRRGALQGVSQGILASTVAAYASSPVEPGRELVDRWAHQRRDFLRLANEHPTLWHWAMGWSSRSHGCTGYAAPSSTMLPPIRRFIASDVQLRELIASMDIGCHSGVADEQLAAPARKVLRTMQAYWPGLVLFLDHPWLDLDNNAAERALRPAVVGRKNFYGSGSQWSGQLAATMMSLLNTVKLWGLNPRLWLSSYLQACAQAGGRAPDDWARFMPWQMDERTGRHGSATDIATIDSS